MLITCKYCGNSFSDSNKNCPHCGAQNEGVVRSTSRKPTTIQELQAWYKAKGLPPEDVTRFYIGKDYKKPKAFGIYQDSATGEFVVYKNKDTGERAVRYRGTDEAYAVNELYQRLKQEIVQQKSRQSGGSSGTRSGSSAYRGRNNSSYKQSKTSKAKSYLQKLEDGPFGLLVCLLELVIGLGGMAFLGLAGIVALLVVLGLVVMLFDTSPSSGYYSYQDAIYYYNYQAYQGNDLHWYRFDTDSNEWQYPTDYTAITEEFDKDKTAKEYYLCYEWVDTLACSDYKDSIYAQDISKGTSVNSGYYQYENQYYYHLGSDYNSRWYSYDDDTGWSSIDYDSMPDDLQHTSIAEDFYYTDAWDPSTQISDFADTSYYSAYEESTTRSYSSSSSESSWSWDDDDDDDSFWSSSWDSSDSWDSDSSDWSSDW